MIYRLTRLTTAAARGGVNASVDAEIRGIAKSNDLFEFTIANEVVAARLGQTLGLPVPAGVIAEDSSGKFFYLSLDVSKTGHALPPVDPVEVVANEAKMAAGALIFDVLIANEDRHAGNLSLDPAFTPPRLTLFDHGHSLLGSGVPSGSDRLIATRDSLGCTGTSGNRHALLDHVTSATDLEGWIDRVERLPDYVVSDACRTVAESGLNVTPALAADLEDWLQQRRTGIRALIEANKPEFKAVTAWTLPPGS